MTQEEYKNAVDTLIGAESRLQGLLKSKADAIQVQAAAEVVHRANEALNQLIADATPDERRRVSVSLTQKGRSSEWSRINDDGQA